jgi:hypothetical protein
VLFVFLTDWREPIWNQELLYKCIGRFKMSMVRAKATAELPYRRADEMRPSP